ncbi:AraC family transcriptional regulator [Paenibacillus sp. TRM 82003]|nr:AraC family transcriptional regulator [Paenibacillus sp. TRM 82003]
MDKSLLKEARVHGEPVYPVSTYRITCPPDRPLLDLHWHDELEFLIMVEGEAVFRVDAADYTVRAGEAIFVNSGELHSGVVAGAEPVTFCAVVFHSALFGDGVHDKVYERYIFPLVDKTYVVPSHLTPATDACRDILSLLGQLFEANESEAPMRELTTKGLLHLCVSKLLLAGGGARREGKADAGGEKLERLKRVIARIEERYEESISLGELAEVAQMSESYFCRYFKRITTKTPVEYINDYRIGRAAALLRQSNRKVMDIALDVGFSNLNYFNTVFKKRFGCTPSSFRRTQA